MDSINARTSQPERVGSARDSVGETFHMSKKLYILQLIVAVLVSLVIFGVGLIIGVPLAISATLKYRFTYLSIDDKKVTFHKGWLNKITKQVSLERINTFDVQIPFLGNSFDAGNVRILAGNDRDGIVFRGISNAPRLRILVEKYWLSRD
jgi:uncharacterized membrane protein YdbT with pleckstrin-like domain